VVEDVARLRPPAALELLDPTLTDDEALLLERLELDARDRRWRRSERAVRRLDRLDREQRSADLASPASAAAKAAALSRVAAISMTAPYEMQAARPR
jgi:hypothetical protein